MNSMGARMPMSFTPMQAANFEDTARMVEREGGVYRASVFRGLGYFSVRMSASMVIIYSSLMEVQKVQRCAPTYNPSETQKALNPNP